MKQSLLFRLLLSLGVFLWGSVWAFAQSTEIVPTITFDQFAVFPNQFRSETDPPYGSNRWVVSSIYEGVGDTVPATPSQEEVEGGDKINNPNTNYLHITFDPRLQGNASYNTRDSSNNFSSFFFPGLGQQICTADFREVTMSFFYVNPTDAEVDLYYNLFDGEGWIRYEKMPSLANQKIWKRIEITDTLFGKKRFIAFGFNWRNKADNNPGTPKYLTAIGIDDVSFTGVPFDEPRTLTVVSDSAVVCLNDLMTVKVNHSRPFCGGGFYQFFLSNSSGTFTPGNTVGFLGSVGDQNRLLNPSAIRDWTITVGINNDNPRNPPVVASKCYRVLVRLIEQDPTTGQFSIGGLDSTDCFEVRDCGTYPRTQNPILVFVEDSSICKQSSFELPFTSNGRFEAANRYIAQLSDVNGSFARPIEIGSITDSTIYRGNAFPLWGKIPVKIPANVRPGCGYKMRVISTAPASLGRGETRPFCITECDIEANGAQDIPEICVNVTEDAGTVRIPFKIHRWSDTAVYRPGNVFRLFLFERANLGRRNFGNIELQTQGDSAFVLNLGVWPQSFNLYTLANGNYYGQIISFDSTDRGFVQRQTSNYFKFGYGVVPVDDRLVMSDSVACKGPQGSIFTFCLPGHEQNLVNNFFDNGNYRLYSNELFGNDEDFFDIPNEFIIFDPVKNCFAVSLNIGQLSEDLTLSFFTMRVQYASALNGCLGPMSSLDTITIQSGIANPIFFTNLGESVCLQDTATMIQVKNWEGYSYQFSVTPFAEVFDQSREGTGNSAKIRFPRGGTYTIRVIGTGQCTQDTTEKTIRVGDMSNVEVLPNREFPDFKMCTPDTILLRMRGADSYTWAPTGPTLKVGSGGASAEAFPTATTTYTITGRIGNCTATTTVTVTVLPRPAAFSIQQEGNKVFITRPRNVGEVLQWTRDNVDIPGANGDTLVMTRNGVYRLVVSNGDGCARRINASVNWTSRNEDLLSSLNFTVSPNPFRGTTQLLYNLTDRTDMNIEIYDLQGRLLKTVLNEKQNPGQYSYSLNMTEMGFSSGTYLIKVKAGNATGSLRMISVD